VLQIQKELRIVSEYKGLLNAVPLRSIVAVNTSIVGGPVGLWVLIRAYSTSARQKHGSTAISNLHHELYTRM